MELHAWTVADENEQLARDSFQAVWNDGSR